MVTKNALTPTSQALSLSSYILIAANLIPLIGVLFFAWDTQVVLALYWFENLIIGLFNVFKMLTVSAVNKNVEGFFLTAFFVVHYGIFCMGHGSLLADIIGFKELVEQTESSYINSGIASDLINSLMAVMQTFYQQLSPMIVYGLIALFLSRTVSFIEHFILRGELFKTEAKKLMAAPYGQIFVMHAGLLLGGFLLQRLQSPVWLLVIIVLFKIALDYKLHKKRHAKMADSVAIN